MSYATDAVKWAVGIANDNSHGYSQTIRWSPSYDCSSLVISAYEHAGVPVRTRGANTTANMYPVFLSCGFRDVTSQVNLQTGAGLVIGDVLLYDNRAKNEGHTVLYIGNGQIVHARSSEGTTDTADNSGNEIRTQSYWNYPWSFCLRLQGVDSPAITQAVSEATETCSLDGVPVLKKGDKSRAVEMAQQGLKSMGYNIGAVYPDGDFGNGTEAGVNFLKFGYGLPQDGKIDKEVWKILLGD